MVAANLIMHAGGCGQKIHPGRIDELVHSCELVDGSSSYLNLLCGLYLALSSSVILTKQALSELDKI